MNIIQWVKGVFNRMFSPQSITSALKIQPTISSKMRTAIDLWEQMYKDESPWLNESPTAKIVSLGLPAMISSEKARMATIEMSAKITGTSERAKYISTQFEKVVKTIRTNLEYGIALGGLVVKPYVMKGVDGKYKIEVNYVKATNFYPLSFSPEGNITEAAFVDRIITKDNIFSKLEHHKLVGTTLTIHNLCFKSSAYVTTSFEDYDTLGTPIDLVNVPQWADTPAEVVIENIDELLFAYFKMPQANTVDLESPLGVSGFSRAVELIKNADEQYSALLWEFEGGQLAIDVDRTALNPLQANGSHGTIALPKLQERLFRHDLDLGSDEVYNVFSPQLRDSNYINGLNNILMHIEDVCDLARGTISTVTYSEARTATELKILKQRSFSANEDIQKELQRVLEHVIRIMDKYCDLYNIVPAGDYEAGFCWDDSIIVDKDAERQIDLLDVDKKLLSRVEYRMKWFGETEAQAKAAIKKIDEADLEKVQEQQSLMVGMSTNPNNNQDSAEPQDKSQKQSENDKDKKANESGKVREHE